MQHVDQQQKDNIDHNKFVLARKYCFYISFSNCIFQLTQLSDYFKDDIMQDSPEHLYVVRLVYWFLWLVSFVILVYTKCNEKRIYLVYYAVHVIMLRNTIYFFDFDEKRKREDQFLKIVYLFIQICGVFFLQIFHNLLQESKLLNFFATLVTCTLITIGLYIIPV